MAHASPSDAENARLNTPCEPGGVPLLLLDGGTGRELLRLGAPFRQPEWSALALIEAPDFVTRVHERFVDAGADVLTTNSYAIVPFHIGEARFAHDAVALASLAGRLARDVAQSAPRAVRVLGSLPPACGSYRPDLFDARVATPVLQRLIEGLAPHVDGWLAETLSSTAEMRLAAELVAPTSLPWWVSFTLTEDAQSATNPRLRSGEPVAVAAQVAANLGASALLFNCCQPEVIAPAIRAADQALGAQATKTLRLGGYANAFDPQGKSARANEELHDLRSDLSPEQYLTWVREWVGLHASIVGGCCGVGPEHIRAIREWMDRDRKSSR